MTYLIRVAGANFGYGKSQILKGVDLTVLPQDFLAILGPNGSGKTTLFRGLLGLISPTAGQVERKSEGIGFVPQLEQLDMAWPLSVLEMLEMGIPGRATKELREQALGNLERVGLAGQERAVFAKLSGGQRQRVLIARALLGKPEILFLDEPTSGVDRPNQEIIMNLLGDLNRAPGGPAILMVSHELELLKPLISGAIWVDGHQGVRRLGKQELEAGAGIADLFQSQTSA